MKIIKIKVEEMNNAGCTNGNYPEYTVCFDNGEKYTGVTCRCGSGCSGTDCIRNIKVGMEFDFIGDYEKFIGE